MWKLDQSKIVGLLNEKAENGDASHGHIIMPGKRFKEIRGGDWIVYFDCRNGLDYQRWDGDTRDGTVSETADGYRHLSAYSGLVWAIVFDGSAELSDDMDDEQRPSKGDVAVVWYEDADGGVALSEFMADDSMPGGFKTKIMAFVIQDMIVSNDGRLRLKSSDEFRSWLPLGGPGTVIHKIIIVHGSDVSHVE